MHRGTSRTGAARLAASCTECQRRKQKCSRDWPCNHCQARRISHLCRFVSNNTTRVSKRGANRAVGQSRALGSRHDSNVEKSEQGSSPGLEVPVTNISAPDFRVLGYLPDYQNSQGASTSTGQPLAPEMDSVLYILPPKPYTDILVQHFLRDINNHYCCLYPPKFSDDYSRWWAERASGESISSEFTCLLLRVCACSAQFLGLGSQEKFETELGDKTQNLSENYHRAAQRLSSAILPGQGGLVQVQQLFLTAYWLKTEAAFVESWHALAAAVHTAQELGMYKCSFETGITEFDREMRRRVWCLLYIWDWQMSTLLSRPLIINDSCCSFEFPNMRLENRDIHSGLPSPIAHTVLQCQLRMALSKAPTLLAESSAPAHADTIQLETEKWFTSFPPFYRVTDPDTQWDDEHRYVALQRCQLHVIGYMTMLCPLKSCLTRSIISQSKLISERSLKERAIDVSLKLIDASHRLFDLIFPTNPKSHFTTFLIFDTASCLCAAVIHDSDHGLPQRNKVIEAIGLAVSMMQKLYPHSKGAAVCYAILRKLVVNLSLSSQESTIFHSLFSPNSDMQLETSRSQNHATTSSPGNVFTPNVVSPSETFPSGIDASGFLDLPDSEMDAFQTANLADIANMDLGWLGQIWDWGNLDLNL